ncbi:hypothetical protein DCC39_04155 [Pueribacillus theae]|uniref:Nuclease SbcCD subunit C n=1 Tax=Pueribacillus theae TaxID=2171751 RepID=A0A2U1K5N9_9BACI|nr:AAA family ATPase [Pueribacillus theae]PWA12846.1 hypothetical protein DCC39_04155 [Pueribacillus theae]
MRPIELTISGLHSFREKQVINFETLREVGVFGIFGSTGSGKSSILDAMTLALYGKVERAANNTQGILNHAENTVTVSFTFEIGKSESGGRYRIERTYKRSGDISVRTSLCRFVEIGEEEIVLADKEREVTANVQQLLGLTIDDFTRAVVLPQGKFAEFLSLKGADRRKMLERLFHLEIYGERLNKRLKTKLESERSKLNEITASQLELGDATAEDVKRAKEEANKAAQNFAVKKTEMENAEKIYQAQSEIWKLQIEKQQTEEKKKALEQEEQEIDKLKSELHKAQEADRLKPYLTDLNEAEKAVSDCEKDLDEIRKELLHTREEFETARKDYEITKQNLDEMMPKLIQKTETFKSAIELEKQWKEKSSEMDKLKKSLLSIKEELKTEEKILASALGELKKAIDLQEALEVELDSCTVTSDERQSIQDALYDKRAIDVLNEKEKEIGEELKTSKKQFEAKQKAYQRSSGMLKQHQKQGLELFQSIETLYNQASECKRACESFEKKLVKEKEKAEQNLDDLRKEELARELHASLQVGDPCPVCGSINHQKKSFETHSSSDTEVVKGKIEKITTAIEEIKTKHYEIDLARTKSTQQIETLSEHLNEQPSLSEFKQQSSEYSLAELISEINNLNQDIIEQENRLRHFVRNNNQYEQELLKSKSEWEQSNEFHQELVRKMKEITTKKEYALERWKEKYPQKNLSEIEQEQKNINERDKKATELKSRLQASIPYIQKRQKTIEHTKELLGNLKLKKERVESEVHYLEKDVNQIKAQIAHITNGQPASQLLSKAEQRLIELKQAEKAASERFKIKNEQKQVLENKENVKQERLKQISKHKETTQKRWDEQVTTSIFESKEELESAFVGSNQQEEWEARIESFFEAFHAVTHDLTRLNNQLKDNQLTEQEWKKSEDDLKQSKQLYNEAMETKSQTEYHYKNVEQRHKRFMELETIRKKAQKTVEQLSKLETVFRGNAFVEFMAEEQLMQVTRDASARLGNLTRQRYAIEVNSDGGFVIRDNANGGVKRPVSTLSGGETFLTSLALALSLSANIQLRGKYPLEFFFLDEGFGTLDQELLDTVITSLEKLNMDNLSIGVISHVPELKARLARKLIVQPAEPSGRGSRISLST